MSAGTKILVVEDEVEIATNLRDILAIDNYVALLAHTPNDALMIAREQRPDLVLMDINLGAEMDGIATARNILNEMSVPIVYVTAYCDSETVDRASATVPASYLVKPFEAKDVLTAVRVCLSNFRLQRETSEDTARFRLTQNCTTEAFAFVDSNGKIQSLSNRARELLGVGDKEACGMDVRDLIQPVATGGRDHEKHTLEELLRPKESEGKTRATEVVSRLTQAHLSCRHLGCPTQNECALLLGEWDVTATAASGAGDEAAPAKDRFAIVLMVNHLHQFSKRFGRAAADQIRDVYEQYVAQNCPDWLTFQPREDHAIVLIGDERKRSPEFEHEISHLVATPMSYLLQLPTRTALIQITASLQTVPPDSELGLEGCIEHTVRSLSPDTANRQRQ